MWHVDSRGRLLFVNATGQVVGYYGDNAEGLPAGVLRMQPPPDVLAAYESGDREAFDQATATSGRTLTSAIPAPTVTPTPTRPPAGVVSSSLPAPAAGASAGEQRGVLPSPALLSAWNDIDVSTFDIADKIEGLRQREQELREAWQTSGFGDLPPAFAQGLADQPIPGLNQSFTAVSELVATNPAYLEQFRRAGLDIPANAEINRRTRVLNELATELKRRGAAVADFKKFGQAYHGAEALRRMGPQNAEQAQTLAELESFRDEWLVANRPREWEAELRRRSEEGLRTGTMQPYQTRNLTSEQERAALAKRPAWATPAVESNEQIVARTLGLSLPQMSAGGRVPRLAAGDVFEQGLASSPWPPAPLDSLASSPWPPAPLDSPAPPSSEAAQIEAEAAHAAEIQAQEGRLRQAQEQDRLERLRMSLGDDQQRVQYQLRQVEDEHRLAMAALTSEAQQTLAQIERDRVATQEESRWQLASLQQQQAAIDQEHTALEQQYATRVVQVQARMAEGLGTAQLSRAQLHGENPFAQQYLGAPPSAGVLPMLGSRMDVVVPPPPGVGAAA